MIHVKRPYETIFIANASLEDAQIESIIGHIQEVITRNGGELTSTNRWGRKRLAYPIQKKNNGFYVHIEMTAPGLAISQLERSYLLDENILRFLTIQLDQKAIEARAQAQRALPAGALETEAAQRSSSDASSTREPLFSDEPRAKDDERNG